MKNCGDGWKRVSKTNNNPFISLELDLGVLGKVKAVMFPNSKKKDPLDPDYNILIADDQPKASPAGSKKPYVKPKITPRAQQPEVPEPDWTHPVEAGSSWDDGTPMGEEF